MTVKSLSLDSVVDVLVSLSLKSATRKAFNLGLIIGSSTKASGETTSPVIPTAERVRIYTDTDDMLNDGFTADSAEYKAALLYFAASPLSPRRLAVGCWDKGSSETAVAAVQACREANSEWYAVTVCGAVNSDIEAIAAYVESASPTTVYFYTVTSADVLSVTGESTDIFIALKGKLYKRSIGQYCGQGDTPDAAAATMGYAMGNNTSLANSAYTLAYKTLTGVTPDSLTETQLEYVKGNNGNVYIQRGGYYNVFEQGYMANMDSFDEVINLDMLANDIQLNVMDLLYGNPKIPQTDAGITQIINVINQACDKYVKIGFVAPGTWNGSAILNDDGKGLATGDTLTKGYLVLSESLSSQSQADRDARKAPPIYVAVKLAGAVEFVTIQVDVNR